MTTTDDEIVALTGSDLPKETMFHLKHGDNVSDRLTPELMASICDLLSRSTINFNGRVCNIKVLGSGASQNAKGEWRVLFDVEHPSEDFDHIEFKVTKTGWGRAVK